MQDSNAAAPIILDADLEVQVRDFLVTFAEQAGRIARLYFRADVQVDSKIDGTPVTAADREIELLFRQLVERAFPGHGLTGEEFGERDSSGKYSWIVDPIDGTKSFAAGLLDWGTIAAFCVDRIPVIGLISQPVLQEIMIGSPTGTTLNGEPVSVREPDGLQEAVLLVTDQQNYHRYRPYEPFSRLASQVKMVRSFGNCHQYLLLAAGCVHIALDPIGARWDIAPLIPVVRGAGGVITDFLGKEPYLGDSVLAATPRLHRQVLGILTAG